MPKLQYPNPKESRGCDFIGHRIFPSWIGDFTATDSAGRLFNIVEKGRPLTELF
jgi:hypothetical protein